MFDIYNL
ncbi:hypothetical protein ECTW15901_2355, partial [Escherichia coli TW15901]